MATVAVPEVTVLVVEKHVVEPYVDTDESSESVDIVDGVASGPAMSGNVLGNLCGIGT